MGKQAKEKAFQQYYDDLVELAKLYYIHKSVKTAEEFAKELDIDVDDFIKQAWDEATKIGSTMVDEPVQKKETILGYPKSSKPIGQIEGGAISNPMKEFISKLRSNKKSLILVAVAICIVIVILGFILPNWFYFNAPRTNYETLFMGQKVLMDKYSKYRDDNGRLDSIIIRDYYWTPSFFCWEIHYQKKFTIYSPSYIIER